MDCASAPATTALNTGGHLFDNMMPTYDELQEVCTNFGDSVKFWTGVWAPPNQDSYFNNRTQEQFDPNGTHFSPSSYALESLKNISKQY